MNFTAKVTGCKKCFDYKVFPHVGNLTNKDRLCERSEPRSYPGLDKPELGTALAICNYLFLWIAAMEISCNIKGI